MGLQVRKPAFKKTAGTHFYREARARRHAAVCTLASRGSESSDLTDSDRDGGTVPRATASA
jgi:hypothetical protein